ncbi:preprotein translocase subunit YajC, partial [Salmonella enterica subsp. enterica serovar Wilhelmsburg]
MLVVLGLIFYFMILRPQLKRPTERRRRMDWSALAEEVLPQGG